MTRLKNFNTHVLCLSPTQRLSQPALVQTSHWQTWTAPPTTAWVQEPWGDRCPAPPPPGTHTHTGTACTHTSRNTHTRRLRGTHVDSEAHTHSVHTLNGTHTHRNITNAHSNTNTHLIKHAQEHRNNAHRHTHRSRHLDTQTHRYRNSLICLNSIHFFLLHWVFEVKSVRDADRCAATWTSPVCRWRLCGSF